MISLRSVLTPLNLQSFRALEAFTKIPDESFRRQVSRALIMLHHERLGGLRGRIGIPMGDLRPVDGGFMKPYSGGFIKLLDFADGPQGIHTHRAEVRFVGFRCHEQSESGPDKPYFIVSVQGVNDEGRVTKTFGPFENVETGDNKFIGEIVTRNAQPPFTIFVVGMENDSGSPDEASAEVEKTLNATAAKVQLSLAVLGVNPAIGSMVQSFINIFGGSVGDVTSAVFGMGDDSIGQNQIVLFDYNPDLAEWRPPKQLRAPDFDKPFNVELVLADGEGGRYSAFLQVNLFSGPEVPVAADK
jgi:hypothetical protein